MQSDKGSLHLGLALMGERERLDVPAGGPDVADDEYLRMSAYLAGSYKASQAVTLASTTYVQPRLDDSDDIRLLEDASMGVALGGPFSLKLSLTVRYDGAPPSGVKEIDTAWMNRLVIDF